MQENFGWRKARSLLTLLTLFLAAGIGPLAADEGNSPVADEYVRDAEAALTRDEYLEAVT